MMQDDTERDLTDRLRGVQPPFAELLQIEITSAAATRIEARMPVTQAHSNMNGVLHGGALMALADNVAGTATAFHLKEGQTTTTVESKTNFFRALKVGDVAHSCTTPLHLGRRTIIWQTEIRRNDGKPAGVVIQTQIVMPL
ncbi:1,4-dihydroxy-2-naphthoyl-CoA hydrolase [Roseovarius sp. MBR-51]